MKRKTLTPPEAALLLLLLHGVLAAVETAAVHSENGALGNLSETDDENRHGNGTEGGHTSGVTLAAINFEGVKTPLVITVVIILAALCKMGFHRSDFLSSKVPESCLLILIGVVLGAILHFSGAVNDLPDFFAPHEFFLYLLPPIILEASFSLHDRAFYNNLGGILLFAVIGTVIAFFTIGYTLYGLAISGAMGAFQVEISATEILIFSALIVAVDPVAVLAVFDEVGVNAVLYFMVFGESLLNDGVTVVIYKVMQEFNEMESVDGLQIFLGFIAFLVVAGGGLLLGLILGVLSAVVTKYTNSVRVVEPIVVFGFAYLSYIMAELFEFSGIISMIACGLVQMQYTFHNITDKSRTTIKYFTKVIATTNEIIIFLFLGLALVRPDHDFHVGFVLWTLFLCLAFRVAITYGLSFLLNRFDRYRVRQLSIQEMFIISYGGLRGAVCFSLVAMLNPHEVPHKRMFVTTTLAVVIFTVFIQGITIKPFVKLLEITLAPKEEPTLYQELNSQVSDHMMAGIEDVIGFHGKFHFKEVLEFYDDKYLKRWLQRNPYRADDDILRIYSKLALRDHVENLYACNAAQIPNSPAIARALSLTDDDHELIKRLSGDDPRRSVFEPTRMSLMQTEDEEGKALMKPDDVEIQVGSIFRRRTNKGRLNNPDIVTYKDLRKHLVKNPSRKMMHMKYDPNIKREEQTDILQHLHEKHMRARRLQERAVSMQPQLERCMSWCGAQDDRKNVAEAEARLRHYKTMSLDVSSLKGQPIEPNRLLGGANMSPSLLRKISEDVENETEEDNKNQKRPAERKRSLLQRSDAMSESRSNEDIPMATLNEKKGE